MKNQNHSVSPKTSCRNIIYACCTLLISFAISSNSLALDPPPGGGYPGDITALGQDALFNQINDKNVENTAIGFEALYGNTLGVGNTAVGANALHDNISGDSNTAIGNLALTKNTTGFSNTAVGDTALRYNTAGVSNTAIGSQVLGLSGGDGNTAVGDGAQFYTSTGEFNTAIGQNALTFTTSGNENVAVGHGALSQNATGSYNIGIGSVAGQKLSTGSHNIEIGNQGTATDNRIIRIGELRTHKNTYMAGISGVTVAAGVAVIIDDKGHLGTVTSSARYKEAIKPMDKSSEAIFSLNPVSFRYKQKLDPQRILQFGLVAEEVADVNPDLVARDEDGKPYTVRYEAVNAMLLNEFLKEHKKVEDQANKIERLENQLQKMAARLDAKGL